MYGMFISFTKFSSKKFSKYILHISVALGVVAGFIKFLFRLSNARKYNLTLIKINRYIIITVAVLALITLIMCLLKLLIKKLNKDSYSLAISLMLALTLFFGFIYLSSFAYQMMGEFVYFGETALSTMALLRTIGFIIGFILCIIVLNSIVKLSRYLTEKQFTIFLSLSLFVFIIMQGSRAIAAMYKLKFFSFSKIVFNIVVFADNQHKTMIYCLLGVGLAMLLFVYFKNLKVKGEFKNNALRRKAKSIARSARRYSATLFACILMTIFVLTVVHYYVTKPPELAKAQPYDIEENKIIINFEDINDGHLHRFSYETPKGYNLRFIAVKKTTGEAYGLGLDACEICGIAGYYERGDEVVCKMCDVVMNKNTIGFKGGCNPIPFPYVVENQRIIIDIDDLLREENRFKE